MKNTCLIFGTGSIGKSVAGYVFNRLGFKTVFVDVSRPVIDDINNRKSYRIFQSENRFDSVKVDNVTAVDLNNKTDVFDLICSVDYVCTAVGMKGFDSVISVLFQGIKARNSAGNKNPLYIMLCENNSDIYTYTLNKLCKFLERKELNNIYLIDTSIERMTKLKISKESEYDVVAEEFYPIILASCRINNNNLFLQNPELFMPVEDLNAYYYRKLYTNNMGHAVLGYIGYSCGYNNIIQSIKDADNYKILWSALNEAGDMLVKKFGFSKESMDKHLKELIKRYCNEGLCDTVERVIREPIRKLSRYERLTGAASLCMEYGIYPEGIIKTIEYVFRYYNPDDVQSVELNMMIKDKGMDYVLINICGLNDHDLLYGELIKFK